MLILVSGERVVIYGDLSFGREQRRGCLPERLDRWVDLFFYIAIGKFWERLTSAIEIYRIVSSKSLESSGDVIKPSGGETILVAPTADDGGAKQGGKCC
jgi:hypothetical protein